MTFLRRVGYDPLKRYATLAGPLKQLGALRSPSGTGLKVGSIPPAGTFAVAQASFRWESEASLARPDEDQRRGVEFIVGPDPERLPERLVLFAGNERFAVSLDSAAREKWISAWLYLRHRTDDRECPQELRDELAKVTRFLQNALTDSKDPRHVTLRREIRRQARAERGPGARGE
jgi:hypothetical protein